MRRGFRREDFFGKVDALSPKKLLYKLPFARHNSSLFCHIFRKKYELLFCYFPIFNAFAREIKYQAKGRIIRRKIEKVFRILAWCVQ